MISFTGWDWMLMLAVATQATCIVYLRQPRLKAFVLSLPVPFTLAFLSIGKQIDITNITGLVLFLVYNHAVRLLYKKLRLPIIPAIAIATIAYALAASGLAAFLPQAPLYFWFACGLVAFLAVVFQAWFKPAEEPGYRTSLPVWLKFAVIAGVIFFIILIKKQLQGFLTVFPMVSVVALYEARYSLRTICRQMAVFVLIALPMQVVIRLVQPALGIYWALLAGWVVYLSILLPVTRWQWKRLEE